jgi:acyl-CoA dehydrogenase
MSEQTGSTAILNWLFSQREHIDTKVLPSISDWKGLFDAVTSGWEIPADRAVIGGFLADRTAYAFASGYQSALRRLLPALPEKAIASFCVSEEKGGHPSSIRSTLAKSNDFHDAEWRLNGSKKFITMANESEILLVAASTGTAPDGKNMIRMALVTKNAPGVEITVMKGLPFVPEISHGTVFFRDVSVKETDLLPGDGYLEYIRPFRTVEDLHVLLAVGGFIFRLASVFRWPRFLHERLASLIVCARALSIEDPKAATIHITLAGLQAQFALLLESTSDYWDTADDMTKAAWLRDSALLRVAENARIKRLDTAWSSFV